MTDDGRDRPLIFQQDGVPSHFGNNYLEMHRATKIDLFLWPTQSPQLKIIESF